MRRREFITLIGGTAVTWPPLAIRAQQPTGLRRVAILMHYDETNPSGRGWLAAFESAMETLGWKEGQNIKYERRWVGDDPALTQSTARQLVASRPDLILSSGSPTTIALLRETRSIPIVFANLVDPVGQGFVKSLSKPGGNATGLVNLEPSMAGKWLELLKQVAPALARIVVPFNLTSAPYADAYLKYFKSTADSLGLALASAPVADMAALETVIARNALELNTGLALMPSGFASEHTHEIVALIKQNPLPAIYSIRDFAQAGGLMTYGNDVTDNYRQAATFVDRILKGEKPSDLPVQFPTKFELVINLKTARSLGVAVPQALLVAADEVIE